MDKIFLSYNNILSNLGSNSESVVENILKGTTGVHKINDPSLLPEIFSASLIPTENLKKKFARIADPEVFTKLEQMMILSLTDILDASEIILDQEVGLIISTTKGNIDVLGQDSQFPKERVYLSELGKIIQNFFGFKNEAIVVSNACVSGSLSISVAKSFIRQGKYKHVFIVSGDLVTKFITSGFKSFQALSADRCKPYDKNRNGINLGEAAASVLVSIDSFNHPESVEILGDGSCNDANHISGPSRTGEGLLRSIKSALTQSEIKVSDIDYISAHGTATLYNDEMEAIAFDRLGLNPVPTNSLKGYFGHTLGASGLLETIVGMHSLHRNVLFNSIGFSEPGTSKPLNIIQSNVDKTLNFFLKTASGFGGSNTAIIYKKTTD